MAFTHPKAINQALASLYSKRKLLELVDNYFFSVPPLRRRAPWYVRVYARTIGRVTSALRSWIHRDCCGY